MLTCQQALQLFKQYFIDRVTVEEATFQAAQKHINECQHCQTKVNKLIQGIQNVAVNPISCEACQSRLADYYEALQANEPVSNDLLSVGLHLLACTDCAAELSALAETMALASANALPPLHAKANFDLSFLPQPVSYWQKMDEQVRQLFSEVVITIREAVAQFAQMPAPLTPMAVMTGATRSQGLHTPAQLLELPKGDSGLNIALQILPPAEEGATLVVLVKDVPDGTPLEHVRVHLYDRERRLLFGLTTDRAGTAHFRELGVGRYLLQVRHGQIKEEIPVLIVTPT